jgi:hypothetical protein
MEKWGGSNPIQILLILCIPVDFPPFPLGVSVVILSGRATFVGT